MSVVSQTSDAAADAAGSKFVATSVYHPRLLRVDAESIRIFLQMYEQYKREVEFHAQQLTVGGITTETVRLVKLKFCVDLEITESALALGFISGFTDYDKLTDDALMIYLEEKAQDSRDSVTLETLDGLVRVGFRMYMSDKDAKSRTEALFMSYHRFLRIHSLV